MCAVCPPAQITRLLAVAAIPPPSGACLSPAGEYNLRLGIMKELRPDLVATHSSPVCVHEGNPFIVEAGVALGGKGAEGLTVHRFANRIPLLFEGGADVCTRTAVTRIPWASYKIDPARVRGTEEQRECEVLRWARRRVCACVWTSLFIGR